MAPYAAVTSLRGTIHLISQSNLDLQDGHKEHLKLLYGKVSSLLEFLDTNSDDESMKDLQEKVKDLAHEIEDKVESHIQREAQRKLLKMLQRVFHLPTKAHERLLKILHRAIEAIDSIKEELFKQRENNNMQVGNSSLFGIPLGRESHVSTLENNMVGYNDEQASMLRQLTGDSPQLEVISIVGMGGIGKSTFAKRVFSDPSVVGFFDVRGWVTMSKDYSIRKMLLSLLQDAGVYLDKVSDEEQADDLQESDEELDHVQKINNALADRLQKSLKGRIYLIVVDDIWSTDTFPEDPFPMRFLDAEESWNLFCQKTFDKKACPIELENVAKEVVENCKRLPLMISVIAGTLSSKRTLDEWRKVAESVRSS